MLHASVRDAASQKKLRITTRKFLVYVTLSDSEHNHTASDSANLPATSCQTASRCASTSGHACARPRHARTSEGCKIATPRAQLRRNSPILASQVAQTHSQTCRPRSRSWRKQAAEKTKSLERRRSTGVEATSKLANLKRGAVDKKLKVSGPVRMPTKKLRIQ